MSSSSTPKWSYGDFLEQNPNASKSERIKAMQAFFKSSREPQIAPPKVPVYRILVNKKSVDLPTSSIREKMDPPKVPAGNITEEKNQNI